MSRVRRDGLVVHLHAFGRSLFCVLAKANIQVSRIHDLAERRRRLWTQGWERWLPDFEARINRLTKLLEDAYAEKRRERTRKP